MDELRNQPSLARIAGIVATTVVVAVVTAVLPHTIQLLVMGEAKPVMTGGSVAVIAAVIASRWWGKSR